MNQTKFWKKALSFVMACLMVLSMVPASQLVAVDANAATSQAMTVYFENNWDWTDVRIYYWDSNEKNNGWPGATLTKCDKTEWEKDIYSFQIPAGTAGIIFNGIKNDDSGNRDQTPDITNIQSVCYYMIWDFGNKVGTYPYPSTQTYTVTFSGANITSTGANKATNDKAYTATLTAADGYVLPAAKDVTVTVGGKVITGYTYSDADGKLSIPANLITGDIVITAKAVKVINVKFTGTNVVSDGATGAYNNDDYTAQLTPSVGFMMPASIEVKIGGVTVTNGSEYTYDNKTGALTIFAASLTGDVEIIASTNELAKYDVQYTLVGITYQNGSSVCSYFKPYSAFLTLNNGYELPVSITVIVGGKALTKGQDFDYNKETGELTIFEDVIDGNVVITASATGKTYDVEFVLDNLNASGNATCTFNEVYTATLTAKEGYSLPSAVQVSVNGQVLSTGYTYKNGVVTIDAPYVTGAIQITAVAGAKNCNITFTGTNVNKESGDTSVPAGKQVVVTLKAASGYALPDSITVKAGSTTLVSGTDYTYSKSTGKVTIKAAAVTDDISITAKATHKYVVLDPGVWDDDVNPVFVVHYWGGSSGSGDVTMKKNDSDGVYFAEIPADATSLLFYRNNPAGGTWNQTGNLTYPTNGNYKYTITGWGSKDGTWGSYTGTLNSGSLKDTFYVNTDIIDYLNNNRVTNNMVNVHSTDNQGLWMTGKRSETNSIYSYLNYIISSNAVQNGKTKYTYPLYFGNLLFLDTRIGTKYGDSTKYSLNNWNTGANVALADNLDAVVQGLVGPKLNEHGQLMDPVTGEQLFYFDKTSVESWKTSDGLHRLMAYYSNLQFPFNAKYDPDTRVTTYSYDSAKDQAVYIDFDNYDASSKSNPMYTGDSTKGYKDSIGFFPLNKPGESGDASNYGFGTKFTIDFTVSTDGVIKSADGTENDVKFSFTGDDDVWVFIDGYLVLDMGGAHCLASGNINFAELNATVERAATVGKNAQDLYNNYTHSYYYSSYNYRGNGEHRDKLDVSKKVTAFPEELAKVFQNEYNTGVSQVHTLTMFYMERGGLDSNMSIEFSMSPVPTGLTVSKDIEGINPGLNDEVQDDDDFSFTVDATHDGNEVLFDGYDLIDHGNITEEGIVNGNIISGIRGDRYAHNFTYGDMDAFFAGTKFLIEEFGFDPVKYPNTRWVLYEYTRAYGEIASGIGTLAEFTLPLDGSGNYALNFINTMKAGTITLSKTYQHNPNISVDSSNMEFVFEVYLDVDGEGYNLHPGLVYDLFEGGAIIGKDLITEDGKIVLKEGQYVEINGIPLGTKYKVVEIDDSNQWDPIDGAVREGEMDLDGVELHYVNRTSATYVDKSIYVEAGTETKYDIKNNGTDIILTQVTSNNDDLTVSISDGHAVVTAGKAGQKYSFAYVGHYSNGTNIYGTVTVYTFAATHKTYVFDFGLSSYLDTTSENEDGLFQGGNFFSKHVSITNVTLQSLKGNGNTETKINFKSGAWIYADGSSSAHVTFIPMAFMTKVENYTYTAQITAPGKTFVSGDPETGCTVTGSIKVMPANTVYYEDNFNVSGTDSTDKIIFGGGANAQTQAPSMMQSNEQSTNYGYDDCYNGGYQYSGNGAVTLENKEYAYFTFTGDGFDLISRTAATSAGMVVYVFKGGFNADHLKYVTDWSVSASPDEMVFVNNYYNKGDLYQIPVVTVRLAEAKTYTVYIQCLASVDPAGNKLNEVQLDGVRIYNPLGNATSDYSKTEQNVNIAELREMFLKKGISLAGNNNGSIFVGSGKGSIIESMVGDKYLTASYLKDVYTHGPNNELYLPQYFGIRMNYTVTSAETFSLQIGMKAIGSAKTVSIYVKGKDGYVNVGTINVTSSTDMYYDLTAMLADFDTENTQYDLVLISDSPDNTNQFVSLTTVKYSGVSI